MQRSDFRFVVAGGLAFLLCLMVGLSVKALFRPENLLPLEYQSRVANYAKINHGTDRIHAFRLVNINEEEVARLRRILLLDKDGFAISFLRPQDIKWWRDDLSAWNMRFGREDRSRENYTSLWFSEDKGEVFLEFGEW